MELLRILFTLGIPNNAVVRGYEIPILESGLRFAAPFMQGPLTNFRQVEAKQVAKSMIKNIRSRNKGESYMYYEDFL